MEKTEKTFMEIYDEIGKQYVDAGISEVVEDIQKLQLLDLIAEEIDIPKIKKEVTELIEKEVEYILKLNVKDYLRAKEIEKKMQDKEDLEDDGGDDDFDN